MSEQTQTIELELYSGGQKVDNMGAKASFDIQDNSSCFNEWVIPNDWTIDGETVKTPMPVEGAVGPKKEWTGTVSEESILYNKYNKGDAYTEEEIQGPFTLEFTVKFDRTTFPDGYVQIDNNGSEHTPDGDARKLSFVANSGVKIGDVVTDPGEADNRIEIAIIDVEKMVDRVGGLLDTFEDSSVWAGEHKDVVKVLDYVSADGVRHYYKPEELTRLLPCVFYNLPFASYGDMYDLSLHDNNTRVAQPTTWQDCYKILSDSYEFFKDLGDNYQISTRPEVP